MMQEYVSIIIVNWNGKKWLKKCIDSLQAQSYTNFEIIVVDNASSDDSISFIQSKYPAIQVIINKTNRGFAGGNNVGIVRAKGKLILLLNNDTWLEHDFLEQAVQSYKANNCDIWAPQEAPYSRGTLNVHSTTIDPLGHPVFDYTNRRANFYFEGVCLLFTKTIYDSTKGLDDNFFMYFEETDWMWRLQLLRKKLYKDTSIMVYHAGAGSTGVGIKYLSFLWRNQNTLQMLLKNYAWYNLLWVIPLYLAQNIVEMLVFLVLFKPKIAYSYMQGWWYNITNIKMIMLKRRWVQENRLVSDLEIIRAMYVGPGKLKHLARYIRVKAT